MGRVDRAIGLARSLAIYHGIPGRQRRLRALYATFVGPGDLVFDIGAHAGNHVRALAALGCRVIAVEPQPDFARLLRTWFGRRPGVTVIEAAVGERPGRARLAVSDRTPTVTTVTGVWRRARAADPDFAGVRWNRCVEVELTTLDQLIDRFGPPAFVKVDAEGSEPAVLAGLTRLAPALSFEYLPRALDAVEASLRELERLGTYRFNWSAGEAYALRSAEWLTGEALLSALGSAEAQRRSGDVYARPRPI